jgi:AcrR family transcriptional regulator
MRRIAREVGCSPMTLYKYYNSKVDILHTLWANVFEDMFDRLDALALLGGSPPRQLTLLASGYVAYWLDNTEHYRLVFMTEGITQPDVNIFVATPVTASRYKVLMLAIINASPTELSQDELKQKLDTLICFLNGIAHNLITISGHDWPSTDHLIRAAIAGVFEE